MTGQFKIDLSQKFEQLRDPPIVEAVLQWRAPAGMELSKESLQEALSAELPDYPMQQDHYETQVQFQFPMGDDADASSAVWNGGWKGLRLVSADSRNIAIFSQNSFTYSRLKPYEGWEAFEAEARRLWGIFGKLAQPDSVDTVGLRFINRIPVERDKDLANYLKEPPSKPGGLPLVSFLYQSGFQVEQEGLFVNVVKTLHENPERELGLILDIDVGTREGLLREPGQDFDATLPKMRWLKNMLFFELLKPELIESFKQGGTE